MQNDKIKMIKMKIYFVLLIFLMFSCSTEQTIERTPKLLKIGGLIKNSDEEISGCLLYTSPSPRDRPLSRMPSSA